MSKDVNKMALWTMIIWFMVGLLIAFMRNNTTTFKQAAEIVAAEKAEMT